MKSKAAILMLALAMIATLGFAQDQSSASAQAPNSQAPPPPPPPAPPQAKKPTRIRVGGTVQVAKIISQTQPVYPEAARQAGIHGAVILHVIIGTDGTVKDVSVVSGDPQLTQSTMDAVRQWRYAPTLLNDDPVEVDTTVTVTYSLEGSGSAAQTTASAGPIAAPPSTPASPPMDPQLRADIFHLFDVIKLRESMAAAVNQVAVQLRSMVLPSLPQTPNRDKIADAFVQKLLAAVQSEEAMDRMATVYANHLSDGDIKALTAFFQTPAGQHYNAVSLDITRESALQGQEIARQSAPKIYSEICSEYPELQGTAAFCPKLPPATPPATQPATPSTTPPAAGGKPSQ